MKLYFEMAVDQETKTREQTFEGIPDPNRPPVPAVQPCPFLSTFGPIMPNHRNMLKTEILGALLVEQKIYCGTFALISSS